MGWVHQVKEGGMTKWQGSLSPEPGPNFPISETTEAHLLCYLLFRQLSLLMLRFYQNGGIILSLGAQNDTQSSAKQDTAPNKS